jgi:hypothetical protein
MSSDDKSNSTVVAAAAADGSSSAVTAAQVCAPLVNALAKYVQAESAAIDGEWEHFAETHQILLDAVRHLREKSGLVVSGINESSEAVDQFLRQLGSKSEEVECTLAVLESVAGGLEEYSKVLLQAFPPEK